MGVTVSAARRIVPVLLLAMIAVQYGHAAAALSQITNTMSANRVCATLTDTITFNTKATYSHVAGIPTNPYNSNYMVNLGWVTTPQNQSWNTSNVNWQWNFIDPDVGQPAWRLQEGTFFTFGTTRYWNGTAKGVAGKPEDGRGRTGQYSVIYNSSGPAAYVAYISGGTVCP